MGESFQLTWTGCSTVVCGSVLLGLPVDCFSFACTEAEYFPLFHVDVFNGLLNVSLVFIF